MDLGFLIDGSGSINSANPTNFAKVKKFVAMIASAFAINPKATRVGAVVYSNSPKPLFNFKRYGNINAVKKAIARTPYPGKGTKTGIALRYIHRYLFNSIAKKVRKKVLVVLTDGKSRDDVRLGSSGLKATGVEVIVIAIGRRVNTAQLLQIASSPSHVLRANFRSLQTLIRKIKRKACSRAPRPIGM